ncbi:unnamed protein product, partial [Linum tenue]
VALTRSQFNPLDITVIKEKREGVFLDLEFTLGRPSWQMDAAIYSAESSNHNELTLLKC